MPSKPKNDVQIPVNPKPEAFWDYLEPIFSFPKPEYMDLIMDSQVIKFF
jgi:hypothetical protein